MTKAQTMQKVKELAREIRRDTIVDVEHLLASGAVNLSDYGNNYELPKILITAASQRNVQNYDRQTPTSRKEIANLVRM